MFSIIAQYLAFSSMSGQNNGSKKNLEKKQDIEQLLRTKKSKPIAVSSNNIKKTEHNVDINA